jgi:hypothetical protein
MSRGFTEPAMALQKQFDEQRKVQSGIDRDTAATHQTHLGVLGGFMSPLTRNPNASIDDINGALNAAQAAGVPPAMIANFRQLIPQNPAAVPNYLQALTMATKHGMDAGKAMLPNVQIQNTGGQQQILNTNPWAGPIGQMPGVQPRTSPASERMPHGDTHNHAGGAQPSSPNTGSPPCGRVTSGTCTRVSSAPNDDQRTWPLTRAAPARFPVVRRPTRQAGGGRERDDEEHDECASFVRFQPCRLDRGH